MTEKDVLRYIYLVDRRLNILTSGVHWKPEYETELEDIDRELSELRFLVDEEHGKRKRKAGNPENPQCRHFNYRSRSGAGGRKKVRKDGKSDKD